MPDKFNGTALSRFGREENGNIAMMFAFCITMCVGIAGAAVDFGVLSSAESRSQQIGDAVALSAAVYVRNKSGNPEDREDGGIPPGRHTAASLGYDFTSLVKGGADEVFIDIEYDQTNSEAVVSVSGKTETTLWRALGKDELDFRTVSVVSFEDVQVNDAASIVLVLDNSGSMNFDDRPYTVNSSGNRVEPVDAVRRIDALESTVMDFINYISPLVGDQSNDKNKMVRTGMLAYNSDTITERTVPMGWRFPTESQVTAMEAQGGTNSAPPLDTAREWMLGTDSPTTGEDYHHNQMNGRTPLKFVIFMTDGINSGDEEWFDQEDTGEWRQLECRRSGNYVFTDNCRYWYETQETQPTSYQGDYSYGGRQYRGYEWTEGQWEIPANHHSLADCKSLKDAGVRVYTIGFALEEGLYEWNGTYWNQEEQAFTQRGIQTSEKRSQAYSFLTACASEGKFRVASDADSLQEAFNSIGQDIVEETIRLKS